MIFASILFLIAFVSPVLGSTNIINNGGFENGLNGWSGYQAKNAVQNFNYSTAYFHSGSYSLIEPDSVQCCIGQNFSITSASTYEFSYYYKHGILGYTPHNFSIVYRGNDSTIVASGIRPGSTADSNGWQQAKVNISLGPGSYYIHANCVTGIIYYDDFSLIDINQKNATGFITASPDVFEYGSLCYYEVNISDIDYTSVVVDIYGKNNTAYTFLETVYPSIRIPYSNKFVSFTAPSIDSGYNSIYAVLRTNDNITLGNSTNVLVTDVGNYFKFVPSVIGYDETSTLYYGYNYNGKYFFDTSPYQIRLITEWDPSSNYRPTFTVTGESSSLIIDGLSNSSSGTYSFGPYNYSSYKIVDGAYVYDSEGNKILQNDSISKKYGLFRDTNHSENDFWLSMRLAEDTLIVDPDKETPSVPLYMSSDDPDSQSNITINNPVVPDSYKPSSYPSPDSPDNDDNNDGNPESGDNLNYPGEEIEEYNSSHYNSDNGTWEYNNDTGSGDGFYPVDVPGNTSVDTSRFQGFYDSVDEAYSPLNNTVNGFLSFLLSPITSISGYIEDTRKYLGNSTIGLVNGSVITECVVPVFAGLPTIIIELIVFGLVLTMIGLLLRGG